MDAYRPELSKSTQTFPVLGDCECKRNLGFVYGPCDCLGDHDHNYVTVKPPHLSHPAQRLNQRGTENSEAACLTIDWDTAIKQPLEQAPLIHKGDSNAYINRSRSAISYLTKRDTICKAHPSFKTRDKKLKEFWTGSAYVGQSNNLGMSGLGSYLMPHGVMYKGHMNDGRFDGEGTLTYPMGLKVNCIHQNGKLLKWDVIFDDGLEYKVPWKYCQMPDRRKFNEIIPSNEDAHISCDPPCQREIPPNCYDTGDGFFEIHMRCIYSANEPNNILRVATQAEEDWIETNCRRAWDKNIGFMPELFELLTTGAGDLDAKRADSNVSLESVLADPRQMEHQTLLAQLLQQPAMFNEVNRKHFGTEWPGQELNTTYSKLTPSNTSRLVMIQDIYGTDGGEIASARGIEKRSSGTTTVVLDEASRSIKGAETYIRTKTVTDKEGSQYVLASVEEKASASKPSIMIEAESKYSHTTGRVSMDATKRWNEGDEKQYQHAQVVFEGPNDSTEIEIKTSRMDVTMGVDSSRHGSVQGVRDDRSMQDIYVEVKTGSEQTVAASTSRHIGPSLALRTKKTPSTLTAEIVAEVAEESLKDLLKARVTTTLPDNDTTISGTRLTQRSYMSHTQSVASSRSRVIRKVGEQKSLRKILDDDSLSSKNFWI